MAVVNVQHVTINMGSTDASATATVTSVDTSRSIVPFSYGIYGGQRQSSAANATDHISCRVELTNSTTVTAYRHASNHAITLSVPVLEFDADLIDSIQTGTINVDGVTSNTDTITSVDTSRSLVIWNGVTGEAAGSMSNTAMLSVKLTNATTVTARRKSTSSNGGIVGYTVVEFAAGVTTSIQEFDITIPSGTSNTATITSVDTSLSSIFSGGLESLNIFWNPDHIPKVELTNGTTVTATMNTGTSGDPTICGTVVEWDTDYIESIQRGTITFTSANTLQDTTITSVDSTASFVQALSTSGDSTATIDTEDESFTIELTSNTNVRVRKNSSGEELSIPYEVVEFSDGPAVGGTPVPVFWHHYNTLARA